jgi:ribonuclease Z
MRPSFHPRLVNNPFSDPGLFIPFLFERRALLFDLGDLRGLSSRDLLKITHVFVTHTHMDHFIGFDELLRISLGREKDLHLFGPPGFFARVDGRLSGYTWNLVNEYENEFTLWTNEVHEQRILTRRHRCRTGFAPESRVSERRFEGHLLEEAPFSVQGVLLDHRIPCLGLSLKEKAYVNIMKEGLKAMDLPVGPWLTRFKRAIHLGDDLKGGFTVTWEQGGKVIREKTYPLGELVEGITKISPGQKITYITDAAGTRENYSRIIRLAEGSDLLFIEAAFLDCEKETAARKYHLTAREAGEIARLSHARRIQLFHFSPRYRGRAAELEREAIAAFEGR